MGKQWSVALLFALGLTVFNSYALGANSDGSLDDPNVATARSQNPMENDCAWGDGSFSDGCDQYDAVERANIERYVAAARAHEATASAVTSFSLHSSMNLVPPGVHK